MCESLLITFLLVASQSNLGSLANWAQFAVRRHSQEAEMARTRRRAPTRVPDGL